MASDGVLVVIPARLASTRLPEKMLLKETGRYLVQHVYERASLIEGATRVVVATDHPRIFDAVREFGGDVEMTSADHQSGSDRAAELARRTDARWIVNVQGDEPELEPRDVDALIAAMSYGVKMGTLVHEDLDDAAQADPSVVKAIVDNGWAVDFTRDPTPGAKRHLGVYAYDRVFLQVYTGLPQTENEKTRRLEQMRAIDNGVEIKAVTARHRSEGIDTRADYEAFKRRTREEQT